MRRRLDAVQPSPPAEGSPRLPPLMTAAWTEPVSFVRVVASLVPRELEAPVTVVHAERMSDDELAAIASQGSSDPLETASRP